MIKRRSLNQFAYSNYSIFLHLQTVLYFFNIYLYVAALRKFESKFYQTINIHFKSFVYGVFFQK